MTTIKELQNNSQHHLSCLEEKDAKVHVLYVSPPFNARGYYRGIVPALELNKTTTHKAILSSIEPSNFNQAFDSYSISLEESLIRWADYIILPTLMDNSNYLMKAIKSLNYQAQIIMDVDRNYFEMFKTDAIKERIHRVKLEQLLSNLLEVDGVIVPNKSLEKSIMNLFETELKEPVPLVFTQASLVSQFGYEELASLKKNETKKIRIGLLKPTEQELLFLKEVLQQIKTFFKDEIEIVCFGKPCISKEADELLKRVDAEIHNTVSFSNYFKKLNDLSLDIVLLPAKGGRYYDEKTANLCKELAAFGITTIASKNHLTTTLIKDKETGFIVKNSDEWFATIKELIVNKSLRQEIGKNALKDVWRHHSFNKVHLTNLTSFFV